MSPLQCLAGRAVLGMSIRRLAELSEVSTPTIERFEHGREITRPNLKALAKVFADAGITFVEDDGKRGVFYPRSLDLQLSS
jgi:transcriptional regulator with XRE-family HTH domain